ncbi:hypothetical protein ACT009_10355 [Sphingomonas sp. Tas61C01]|uniref:hypothetical protein n=1 Tax=Sphingomonas sp. Tas61C01 TaxID=3458297 RepID=UPI00403E7600
MIIAILAAALSPPVAADARCIALMNFMIAKGTPEQQNAARTGTIYFVGKLKGRQPGVNVAAVLKTAADEATRTKMNAQSEVKRCGEEVSTAANSMRPAATPRKP